MIGTTPGFLRYQHRVHRETVAKNRGRWGWRENDALCAAMRLQRRQHMGTVEARRRRLVAAYDQGAIDMETYRLSLYALANLETVPPLAR